MLDVEAALAGARPTSATIPTPPPRRSPARCDAELASTSTAVIDDGRRSAATS